MSGSQSAKAVVRYSLQKRLLLNTLLASVISSVLGLVLVMGFVAYERHEFFDELLEENAELLVDPQQQSSKVAREALDQFHDELEFEYQLLDQHNRILQKSEHAPVQAFTLEKPSDDFSNVYIDQKLWRVYQYHAEDGQSVILIGQTWQQRYEELWPIVGYFLWFMLVVWAVLVLINWWLIKRSFRPVHQISSQLSERHMTNLTPLYPQIMLEELSPIIDAVNQLLEKLQTSIEHEQRFTADAAHELRTPLSAIQMKLQLLQKKHQQLLTPIQADLLQLQSDIKRSTALVENLLLLARLDPESDKNLPKQWLNLKELLQDTRDQFLQQGIDRQNRLSLVWTFDLDQQVYVHKNLFMVAVLNVLENARRYAGEGAHIQWTVMCTSHQQLTVLIQDDGEGVATEDRQRLTQRFFRVLGSEQSGSGLGLSIVQRIAELHQGHIQFEQGIDGKGLGVRLSFYVGED